MKYRLLLTAVLMLCGTWQPAFASPPLEIVTVAANTGGSSGGHSALRAGGQVYQYQVNSDSLLLLRRDSWRFFERHYRQLDNRSLSLVRLALIEPDKKRISNHFGRLFAIQQKHIARWRALEIEQQWFNYLKNQDQAPSIPILAYFDPAITQNPDTLQLQRSANSVLSKPFIYDALTAVNAQLNDSALKSSLCIPHDIAAGVFPSHSEIQAERRLEQLYLREALIILKQGRGLSSTQIIQPDGKTLTRNERSQLQQLTASYENSIPRLLSSNRPDRGEALLLAIARHGVLQLSLRKNRLFLLNVFPNDKRAITLINAKKAQRHQALLLALSGQGNEMWCAVKDFQMAEDHLLSDYGYQKMEDSASRYVQSRDALRDNKDLLTCEPDLLLPLRKGKITPFHQLNPSSETLGTAQQQAADSYKNYLCDIHSIYGYSLLKHNCTTELAKSIQSAFSDHKEIKITLGAVIKENKGLNFIPSIFSQKIQKHWNTSSVRSWPSHRIQQSQTLISKSPNLWTRLRESNRQTSSVYPGSIHDDAFLFFADGKTILRPLQGSANLLYGLTHTGIGIATSPAKIGRLRLKRGLNGMLYSLPEIFGISIRKGRYDILPLHKSSTSE